MTFISLRGGVCTATFCCVIGGASTAQAVTFDTIYSFGNSYSDTGAYVPRTNGGTAVSYLADFFGNSFVLPDNPNPGASSINYAQSGAEVEGGPSMPPPESLNTQVDDHVDLVNSGGASFDPPSTLFFLSGGLNDHTDPAADVTNAYRDQVADLVGLGARYIQIATLPSEVPAFMDSASNLNPAYADLVPELDETYPNVSVTLSNWGTYFDDILLNPAEYGFTNVTDPCLQNFGNENQTACDTPDTHFYYFPAHPSDAAHQVVGQRLYEDTLDLAAVPAPVPVPTPAFLFVGALGALGLVRVRRS